MDDIIQPTLSSDAACDNFSMLTQTEKAEKFQTLHRAPSLFVIPNPWDAGSARILAGCGFAALATSSASFAFSLGRRDYGTSREENFAHCRAIVAAAGDLPVSADLGNCFGDSPESVAETIRLAAATGIAGASVEDASGDDARPIYDFALAVERVAAAVEAARSLPFPFVLTARAENFLHRRPDLDDTIRRLQAFAVAGADIVYAPLLPDLDAVRRVCEAVAPRPVNVLAGRRDFTVAALAELGVRRVSIGSAMSRVAYGALRRAAQEIRDQGTFGALGEGASMAEISRFMA
jgi:2-methylisocitrate lyase-like PEP mutase family enzyme